MSSDTINVALAAKAQSTNLSSSWSASISWKAVAKEAIRAQFAQYGMSNVPDDVLENYAAEQLKKRENVDNFVDRAVDMKLTEALKNVVKLNQKEVTFEEFNKLMQQK